MEQKTLHVTIKAAKGSIAENQFEFEASTVGNPDRIGDVIMPGAFGKATLAEAVKKGWADVAHGWSGEPIGWFDEVRMEGDTLVIKGTYHSTERAQNMRTITKERLDNDKEVAVSIGFNYAWDKSAYFESGADLLKWAEGQGYDLSLLDVKAIKSLKWCTAITKVTELFECSICNVGMNPRARVRDTKQFEEGEAHGQTLPDALISALAAVKRAASVHAQRAEDGRTLSKNHLPTLEAIQEELAPLLAALKAETDPGEKPDIQSEEEALALATAVLASL